MRLWRISEHANLDGAGGLLAPGRWHRIGEPIVYMAESSALALLEIMVHINKTRLPPPYQLLEIGAPDELAIVEWPVDHDASDKELTADWGAAFLRSSTSAALARVPSSVAPESWNYLLNPLHPHAQRITIAAAGRWPWDARLFER